MKKRKVHRDQHQSATFIARPTFKTDGAGLPMSGTITFFGKPVSYTGTLDERTVE